jgi:acetylornithine deacetylase/succinyl-diaminopimelate desuccinylase-like protein
MLPGDDEQHVKMLLTQTVNDERISVSLDSKPIISPESPPTKEILDQTVALAHQFWPNSLIVPTMATGFSDDRQTRNAGIPSYDISGIWIEQGENRAHGRDERVGVNAFDESVEFTYRMLKTMGESR